jgi:hypothetical protein
MYLALVLGCAVVGAALVRSSASSAWKAAAGLSASVFLGFVLSRTTGLSPTPATSATGRSRSERRRSSSRAPWSRSPPESSSPGARYGRSEQRELRRKAAGRCRGWLRFS